MLSAATCVVLGVPVDDVTLDETVESIAAMVRRGRATGRVHQVATVNVDFVVNAVADPATLGVLQRSHLAIPDGMPVVWASRLLGTPIRQRTAGVDLVPAVAARAATEGWRLLLFGGAPGVADEAARVLRLASPLLDVVVVEAPVVARDGTMGVATDRVLDAVREHRADVVCVALGNPKQEHWIARHGSVIGAPVCIGVGGSLDFLAGTTRRAPRWMQQSGLEWLHRALSEPRRLAARYARDFRVFVPGVAAQAWRGRRQRPAVVAVFDRAATPPRVAVAGPLPATAVEPGLEAALTAGDPVVVELCAPAVDNVTCSVLAGWARTARRAGTPIELRGRPADSTMSALLGGPPMRGHSAPECQ